MHGESGSIVCNHAGWERTGPPYRYQGCYDDSSGPYQGGTRTLPQVLDQYRLGVGLDECAAAARSRGFPVFALQGYGQCYFGSTADVSRLQGSQNLSDASCSNLPCAASAASCSGNVNKVFFLIGDMPFPRSQIPEFCLTLQACIESDVSG